MVHFVFGREVFGGVVFGFGVVEDRFEVDDVVFVVVQYLGCRGVGHVEEADQVGVDHLGEHLGLGLLGV